ncbi:MAG: alpha/beta fold hydrolase, partial [Chloroflexota bacterium]
MALTQGAAPAHAASAPAFPAVVAGDGTRTTADAVAAMAGAVAAAAAAAGRAAILPDADAWGVALVLGGCAAPGPVLVLHPRWTAAEMRAACARAGVTLVLHARSGEDLPEDVAGRDVRTLPAAAPLAPAAVLGGPGTLVLPTSGTTAAPRLVRLPAVTLAASAAAWAAFLPPATGWLLSLGLGHVAGIGIVLRALRAGVPIAIPGGGADPVTAIAAAATAGVGVSHCSLVPTQLARALAAGVPPPASLRAALLGGGPIDAPLVRAACAAGWPVVPSYGMTETASGVAAALPAEAADAPAAAGRALPGVLLRVAAPEAPEQPLPPGHAGEIAVRGAVVAAGLLDDPAGWAARLTADGWLRTGDLGTIDASGRLVVTGRIDDLIVRDGENIAPAAVEAVLAAVPGVREAALVGVPDPVHGAIPVALVAAGPGADPADAQILAAARAALAPFRVPARIVRLGALPRGAGEKVLRRALRAPAEAALRRPLPDAAGGPEPRILLADDGLPLAVRAAPRSRGDARPAVVLLHATLGAADALLRLAGELAPDARPLLLDRRGTPASPLAVPGPVAVARHVADVRDLLDASGEARAVLLGHSFGGVVALAFAAAFPDRVAAVLAWEPPWLTLADPADRARLLAVAPAVASAHARDGAPGATRAFLAVVAPDLLARLGPERAAPLLAAGDGVLADAAMPGRPADGPGPIAAPRPARDGRGERAVLPPDRRGARRAAGRRARRGRPRRGPRRPGL